MNLQPFPEHRISNLLHCIPKQPGMNRSTPKQPFEPEGLEPVQGMLGFFEREEFLIVFS